MKKSEFLDALRERLSGLDADYVGRVLEYFSEAIDDRMEDGMSEEDAVSEMGSVEEAARNAAADLPPVIGYHRERAESVDTGRPFEQHTDPNSTKSTIDVTEAFDSIVIEDTYSDVSFVPSGADDVCFIEFVEGTGVSHLVEVRNKTLTISRESNNKSWFSRLLSFSGETASITVHMPAAGYASVSVRTASGDIEVPWDFTFGICDLVSASGDVECHARVEQKLFLKSNSGDVKIKNAVSKTEASSLSGDVKVENIETDDSVTATSISGDVRIENVSCSDISVKSTSGDVKLSNVKCTDATLKSVSGDVVISHLIATGRMSAESTSGDVSISHSDAAELQLRSISGDIEAGLLTAKIFNATSKSGSVRVPVSEHGGECSAKTLSGNIKIVIEQRA